MTQLLPLVVAGLVTGSVYGIAALGLVLTYKTSGVFNFAHGGFAAAGAYLFYELHVMRGMPWPIAATITVVGLGFILGLAMERLARRLAQLNLTMKIVATVGLLLSIQSLLILLYGAAGRSFPAYLPTGTLLIAGVHVGVDQLIMVGITFVVAAGLYLFFRVSFTGLAMRAVVENPDLLALSRTNPVQVRSWAWIIGCCFAVLSGVLIVPVLGLDVNVLNLLVVQAFGAAAIGVFHNLPLTYVGGLFIGVLAAVSTGWVAGVPMLSGLPPTIPFLVLFVALLLTPKRRLIQPVGESRLMMRAESFVRIGRRQIIRLGLFALAVMLVPLVVGPQLPVFTSALVFTAVFLSLHVLVRTAGLLSLSHAAFMAVGAATFSHLTYGAGLPWGLALVLAGLMAIPVGAVVAIPAIRLSGLYLAVATFGLGILLDRLFYRSELMFGPAGRMPVPRPQVAFLGVSGDVGYYYLVAAIVAGMVLLSGGLLRSRLGRLLRTMADSPLALSTLGVSVNVTRVLIFCISAFMAGIAGGLFGALVGSVNYVSFEPFLSLLWLAVLVIAGVLFHHKPLPTAVAAAVGFVVVPSYVGNLIGGVNVMEWLALLFGLAALGNALVADPALLAERGSSHKKTSHSRTGGSDRGARSPVRERVALTVDVAP